MVKKVVLDYNICHSFYQFIIPKPGAAVYGRRIMREFNTTGLCNPDKHYMVDITERLVKIKEMVDAGIYFYIKLPIIRYFWTSWRSFGFCICGGKRIRRIGHSSP